MVSQGVNADYTIRPAQTADVARLAALYLELQDHIEASNPDLWQMTRHARSRVKSQLPARLQAPDSCALVAEHGTDGVVGMAFARITVNQHYSPARTGTIDQLFVGAAHRRRGLGSALVARLCLWFSERDAGDISLRCVSGNQEAAAFWAALGFSPRIITVGAHLDSIGRESGR